MNHGADGYRNRTCHAGAGGQPCDVCRDGHRRQQNADNQERAARLLADPSLAQHGRWSTYANWICRCPDCCREASRYRRRPEKRRTAA